MTSTYGKISLCSFCLTPGCRHGRDKKGNPYVVCNACGARSFLRSTDHAGPELLALLIQLLGGAKLGFLFHCYEKALVLRLLEDHLGSLDDSVTKTVEKALAGLTKGQSMGSQADLAKIIDDMNDHLDDFPEAA